MTTTKEETERRHYLEVLRIAEELQRALDEKTERLEKIEAALCHYEQTIGFDCVPDTYGGAALTGEQLATALIALRERSGK